MFEFLTLPQDLAQFASFRFSYLIYFYNFNWFESYKFCMLSFNKTEDISKKSF